MAEPSEVKLLKLVAGVWEMVDSTTDDITVNKITASVMEVSGQDVFSQLPSTGQKAALAGSDGTPSNGNRYLTESDSRVAFSLTSDEKDALAGTTGSPGDGNRFVTETDPAKVFAPTSAEKDALGGSDGVPSDSNRYVTETDSRMTDSRAPTSHASSHQFGGSDEIAVLNPANNSIPRTGGVSTLDPGWIPDGGDATAIHDNQPGEITAIPEKGAPVQNDWLLIEDSENANNKKKVKIGALPAPVFSLDAFKTAQTIRVNTDTLSIDPHLQITNVPVGNYIFEAHLERAGHSAADQTLSWKIDQSGSGDGRYTTDLDAFQGSLAQLGAEPNCSTSGENTFNTIQFRGWIEVTETGRFGLHWAQATQHQSDSKMDKGSWFRLIPV